jgi:hypothetical protein
MAIRFRHRGKRSLARIGVRGAVGVELASAGIIHNALGHSGRGGKGQENKKDFPQALTRITWGLTGARKHATFAACAVFAAGTGWSSSVL